MPMLIDILTEDLAWVKEKHGLDSFMAQQLQRQIDALKFQESKAGTKQQGVIFGACFNPCDNSE